MRFCIDRVSFPSLIVTCTFLLTDSVYLHQPSLIPVTDRVFCSQKVCLYRRSLIPIADRPLHVSAHRSYVSASTAFALTESHYCRWSSPARFYSQTVRLCIDRISFPSLIVSRTFLLAGGAFLHRPYLHRQSLITVADPLRVSARRECVSVSTVFASTESHYCG